jgi:hypothetical protein
VSVKLSDCRRFGGRFWLMVSSTVCCYGVVQVAPVPSPARGAAMQRATRSPAGAIGSQLALRRRGALWPRASVRQPRANAVDFGLQVFNNTASAFLMERTTPGLAAPTWPLSHLALSHLAALPLGRTPLERDYFRDPPPLSTCCCLDPSNASECFEYASAGPKTPCLPPPGPLRDAQRKRVRIVSPRSDAG